MKDISRAHCRIWYEFDWPARASCAQWRDADETKWAINSDSVDENSSTSSGQRCKSRKKNRKQKSNRPRAALIQICPLARDAFHERIREREQDEMEASHDPFKWVGCFFFFFHFLLFWSSSSRAHASTQHLAVVCVIFIRACIEITFGRQTPVMRSRSTRLTWRPMLPPSCFPKAPRMHRHEIYILFMILIRMLLVFKNIPSNHMSCAGRLSNGPLPSGSS